MKRTTIHDHQAELKHFRQRVALAFVFICILLLAMALRLWHLQVNEHESYQTRSDNNRVRITPVSPNRGLIYDRHNRLVAENIPTFTLTIIPEAVESIDETLNEISTLINLEEHELRRFQQSLKQKRRFEAIPLRFNLNEQERAILSVQSHRLPGVDIQGGLQRHYPYGAALSHVLGYVAQISERDLRNIDSSRYAGTSTIGKIGVEQSYENRLHGEPGHQQIETNARGRALRVLESSSPTPGHNLHLTLDAQLQVKAEHLFDNRRGALVALDPATGAVLALVSHPGFDPNPFVVGISQNNYQTLKTDPKQPLFNRALRGQYPPASTIKPIIALHGLEQGHTTKDFQIFDPGWYQLEGDERRYRDWRREGHGWVDIHHAIVESCDTYFYDLAHKMGIDNIYQSMHLFGLGQATGIDINGEVSGIAPSRDWKRSVIGEIWYPGETLNVGIGQGFSLVTPIQLAKMSMLLANNGLRRNIHVVEKITASDSENTVVETIDIDKIANTIGDKTNKNIHPLTAYRKSNWEIIQKALHDVTHHPRGTASRLSYTGKNTLLGKTGTAQVVSIPQDSEYNPEELDKLFHDHALFIGYAPADDPKIAIGVIIENNKGAADLAQAFTDYFFELEESYLTENPS